MLRHVYIVLSNVLDEHVASIFRVEDKKKSVSKPARAGAADSVCLHGATSQKTAFFIVTAVKTSNLTNNI
jgi:hypothetical protein